MKYKISKFILNIIICIFGLFGNNIIGVNGQVGKENQVVKLSQEGKLSQVGQVDQVNQVSPLVGDCGIFQSAINDLGDDNKQKFITNNCCNLSDVVTCVDNNITEIKLKYIFCRNIRFESTISKLATLKHLTYLEISNGDRCNDLFPNNISELKNLKTLILSHNHFNKDLPGNISKLTNLEKLDLSNNGFKGKIPSSYSNLKNLKTLKLNNNNLSGAVPYEFEKLENLEELNLSNNGELKGYLPKMSKIELCDYKETKLCRISSTTCYKNMGFCTKDDVKETNKENGSPDPKAYIKQVQWFKIWWEEYSWFVPMIPFILIFILVFGYLFGCCAFSLIDDCCLKPLKEKIQNKKHKPASVSEKPLAAPKQQDNSSEIIEESHIMISIEKIRKDNNNAKAKMNNKKNINGKKNVNGNK